MSGLLIPAAEGHLRRQRVEEFWREFKSDSGRPKFVFGCNVYARSILQACSVDGVVDDFSPEASFCGRQIIKTADIPKDALVLVASGGRPLTVRRKLQELGIEQLDYFSLQKWSGAPLKDIVFNEGFCTEYAANEAQYQWVYDRLSDEVSRRSFRQLVSFRFNGDLDVMQEFSDRQRDQYFEDFLGLQSSSEVFVDVGGFDGSTTLEFISRCPGYRAVYVFEPDPGNFLACERRLKGRPNIHLLQIGAGNERGKVSFSASGSTSGIAADGGLTIEVARLDDMVPVRPTFIKMDIEGAELAAISGAARIIREHRPRMALCVYHKPGDFWRIPKQVLGIDPRFDIYLRHYTESIYETVMFFMPRKLAG